MPRLDPTTRVNLRVFADDWQWINQHRPREANRLIRELLRAYVARARAQQPPATD